MVRAKFKVTMIEDGNVSLEVVIDGSEENEKFFDLTPSGQINIGTVNTAALAQFEEGAEYYVDFTKA